MFHIVCTLACWRVALPSALPWEAAAGSQISRNRYIIRRLVVKQKQLTKRSINKHPSCGVHLLDRVWPVRSLAFPFFLSLFLRALLRFTGLASGMGV